MLFEIFCSGLASLLTIPCMQFLLKEGRHETAIITRYPVISLSSTRNLVLSSTLSAKEHDNRILIQ